MHDVLETLKKLPAIAYYDNTGDDRIAFTSDAPIIAVRRGVMGFYPIYTPLKADTLNKREGTTPQQLEAMKFGSLFGWEVPAANPDRWGPEGRLLEAG